MKWARAVPQIFSLCPKNKWKYLFLFLSRVATYVLTIYPSSKWEGNKKDRERETERKKEWEKEIVSNNSWIANLENCQAVLSNVRNISMRYTRKVILTRDLNTLGQTSIHKTTTKTLFIKHASNIACEWKMQSMEEKVRTIERRDEYNFQSSFFVLTKCVLCSFSHFTISRWITFKALEMTSFKSTTSSRWCWWNVKS